MWSAASRAGRDQGGTRSGGSGSRCRRRRSRQQQQRDYCQRHGQNIRNTSTTKSVDAAPFASFGTTVRSGQTSFLDNRSFEANVRSGQAPRSEPNARSGQTCRFGTTEKRENRSGHRQHGPPRRTCCSMRRSMPSRSASSLVKFRALRRHRPGKISDGRQAQFRQARSSPSTTVIGAEQNTHLAAKQESKQDHEEKEEEERNTHQQTKRR